MNTREKDEQFKQAMFPLVGNPHFVHFIDFIKGQRELAMIEAASDRVVSDKRLLTTYLGQVRAFTEIIDTYESFVQSAEDIAERQNESAQ